MSTITKKLAAFVFANSAAFVFENSVTNSPFIMFRSEDNVPDADYLRITDYVEVTFPKVSVEDLLTFQVEAIDTEIEKIKSVALVKVGKLQQRKQELLALEHDEVKT